MASPLLQIFQRSVGSVRYGLPRVVLSARAAAVGDGPHRCSSTGVDADETAAFRRIDDEEANYENDIRTQILDASLSFVIPNGWTQDSLALGAQTLGYSDLSHGIFPKGGVELVYHFEEKSTKQLAALLQQDKDQTKASPSQVKKTGRFLRDAIEMRLRMNADYVRAGRWHEALSLKVLPPNVPLSLQQLTTLMDEMWHQAGDSSVDMSWYTKRAVLAAVYKSTELSMIQDQSDDFEETWQFLDRRMEQVTELHRCAGKCAESPVIFRGLLQTALNMVNAGGFRR